MPGIAVRVEFRETLKALNRFQSRQLPFAIAGALNSTAFDLRREVVSKTYPQSFRVRNKRFARAAFRVEKATKRNLTAEVYDRLERDFLPIHVKGGIRRPTRSSALAIPVNIKRTRTGKIAKAKRPRSLRRAFSSTPRTSHTAHLKRPAAAIWLRTGGKRKPGLKLAYVLKPHVPLKRVFKVDSAAVKTVKANFRRHMRASLKRALASARR